MTVVVRQPPIVEQASRDDAARIARWLIAGPAQQRDGAVAGWVDASGRAGYVYPEITGYYLQWLASRAARCDDRAVLARRAEAAQRWLAAWLAGGAHPPTRIYVSGARADWRNAAIFCFDLAMVLRGLGAAASAQLLVPDAVVVTDLCSLLSRLVARDGQLDACARLHANLTMSLRWSTRRGAFLAKAAAGIIEAAKALPGVPDPLHAAALRTFDASVDALLRTPHTETHPFLYAVEGFLSRPRHANFAAALPAIAAQFARLMQRSAMQGRVPESAGDPGAARLDIVAQALRVGLLLAAHRGDSGVRAPELRQLGDTLARNLGADGALPFAPEATPIQWNVWTCMFAEQALTWTRFDARELTQLAAAPCIV